MIGYEGKFSVSNTGLLKSNKSGKILKPVLNKQGYYAVATKPYGRIGKTKTFKIHREVAKAFIPNPLNKPTVNHLDGVKTNNLVTNLEWATHSENTVHAVDNGMISFVKGTEKVNSKLTPELIALAKSQIIPHNREFGLRAISRKLGVCHTSLRDAINGVTWKD